MDEKIVAKCPLGNCEGKVVEVATQEFDPQHGTLIIGPGSKNQYTARISYHCNICMTIFAGIPAKQQL